MLACDQGFINSPDNHEGALSLRQKSSFLPSRNLLLQKAHYPRPRHTKAQPLLLTQPFSIYLVPWAPAGCDVLAFPQSCDRHHSAPPIVLQALLTQLCAECSPPKPVFGYPNRISLHWPHCLELKQPFLSGPKYRFWHLRLKNSL